MEYLKPIETLESLVKKYQLIIGGLIILLGVLILVVPRMAETGNPLFIQTDNGVARASVGPWKATVTRIEQFSKAYLSARFEWSEDTFSKKKSDLKALVKDTTFQKLKDSLNAFESIAKNQKAKSYYVLEGFGFSNTNHRIEAHVTRVLRIQNAAIATPLKISINYEDTSFSDENPFGLQIVNLEEIETSETSER